ncbi:MAG TPA: response regulator [Phycisphaerae bacterium]|nr:response regulator [Phycisphaerales bacterium]HRX85885.1 response regulator [Phycisphaerae bacterium]
MKSAHRDRTRTNPHAHDAFRVLVAEDDDAMRTLLAEQLLRRGYDVVTCANGVQLLDKLSPFLLGREPIEVDLLISDVRMPGLTGLEVLAGLTHEPGCPPTIIITAFGDQETHEEAARCHAAGFFDKPFEIEALLDRVGEIAAARARDN